MAKAKKKTTTTKKKTIKKKTIKKATPKKATPKKAAKKKAYLNRLKKECLDRLFVYKNSRAGSGLRFHQGTRQYYRR